MNQDTAAAITEAIIQAGTEELGWRIGAATLAWAWLECGKDRETFEAFLVSATEMREDDAEKVASATADGDWEEAYWAAFEA